MRAAAGREVAAAAPLPVFAVATPSHRELLERWFLPSLPADCRAEVREFEAAPVRWAEDGWQRVVAEKLRYIDRAFELTSAGEVFVFSDVDVCFYRPFAEDLRRRMQGLDLAFQNNRPDEPERPAHLCSGFMAVRNSETTRAFFRQAEGILRAADHPEVGDQSACIQALESGRHALRYALLPRRYWLPPRTGRHWQPGESLSPPADIVLHHANRTVGTANKDAQLRQVRALLQAPPPTASRTPTPRPAPPLPGALAPGLPP